MTLNFGTEHMPLTVEITEEGFALLKYFGYGKCRDERPKRAMYCPLAEIHLAGKNPDDHHGGKHTGSWGSYALKYKSHTEVKTATGRRIDFLLTDGSLHVTVSYQLYDGVNALRAWTTVENKGGEAVGLEYVSSFAYTGLDDGEGVPAKQDVRVGVPHNSWLREASWRFNTLSELGLDRISHFSTKRLSLSNTGTWSTKEHLPMGYVENRSAGHCWLFQIEHSGSWQWELSDIGGMLYVKAGGPNEQEHQWYKELQPGERFESVKAAVVVAKDFEGAVSEMTKYRRKIFRSNPENAAMPVIFNDYMNCLNADPTEEKEYPMIDRAAEAGAEYYCIDAGWYAEGGWWDSVGEWQPCEKRFPDIKRVMNYIREKGMIPGLWLEIEVMGVNCPLAAEWEDTCFFMRHGKRVIDHCRYLLDFRHPKVRAHATEVVDRLVNEYGVGYIKMDYNVDGGIGTEVNADSCGDGLLSHHRAYLDWLTETLSRHPSLVFENCSSGGMRMDYAMLAHAHLQSISDQTQYVRMAPIAACAPTAALPEQVAVWSYPLADADADATAFNMVNALLQRIHLSGKITQLSDDSFALMKEGLALYKTYRHLIPTALPFWPLGLPTQQSDLAALGLHAEGRTLLAVWRLDGGADTVEIPLAGEPALLYPSTSDCRLTAGNGSFTLQLPRPRTAVLLEIH